MNYNFKVGDMVYHFHKGRGTIQNLTGVGKQIKVKVQFEDNDDTITIKPFIMKDNKVVLKLIK